LAFWPERVFARAEVLRKTQRCSDGISSDLQAVAVADNRGGVQRDH